MTLPLDGFAFLTVGAGSGVSYAGRLLALLGATVVATDVAAPRRSHEPDRGGPETASGGLILPPQPREILAGLSVAGALDARGALAPAPYPVVSVPPEDPVAAWAASGGMWLTGAAGGPPLGAPADLAGRMRGAAAVLRLLTSLLGTPIVVDGARLLGERAALTGLRRGGRVSAGGTCRLLRAADGWIAVGLPRAQDDELVPAWLGVAVTGDQRWEAVSAAVRGRSAEETVVRAQLLGLPVALLAEPREVAADAQAGARGQTFPFSPWLFGATPPVPRPSRQLERPEEVPVTRAPSPPADVTVVDLSSLWAGPLATGLLREAGLRVVKVEGAGRPDGVRIGSPKLFDLLNAGKQSVEVDLRSPTGVASLRALLEAADVVVEGSRPRALDNLGLGPDPMLRDGQVWASLTAYGRTGPRCQWAGLGDDAAVAGGLVTLDPEGDPVFCGDAIADPAAGLHLAVAIVACLLGGGTRHVDIALREAAGHLLLDAPELPRSVAVASGGGGAGWRVETASGTVEVVPPTARPRPRPGPPLGRDTASVLAELGTTVA